MTDYIVQMIRLLSLSIHTISVDLFCQIKLKIYCTVTSESIRKSDKINDLTVDGVKGTVSREKFARLWMELKEQCHELSLQTETVGG